MRELTKRAIVFRIFTAFWLTTLINRISAAQIMYLANTPEKADIVVFEVTDKAKCDLRIFFEEEPEQLGKPGVWMATFDEG